mmetsp:Transcript_58859/g.166041  ORF Transcript_58859/g.166041 Transcript_58859/m.166041 type:complete len:119 (-) Transcript_58859:73-429(-)
MGNACVHEDRSPLTTERLERAVRRMDAAEVQRCLDGGVHVNRPVDKHGHTILDVFACEHMEMLKNSLSYRGRPEDATKLLCEGEESAIRVLKVLRAHGAKLSAQSGILRSGILNPDPY